MPRTLQQSVVLPASPAKLFSMYMNPRTHAAFIGEPAKICLKGFDGGHAALASGNS